MPATTPAPAPDSVPAVQPITASTPAPAQPWWVPPWPVFLACALVAMTWWIMWVLSPAPGHPPDELFKLLAQAIVLTGFIGGVVATVFTASRDSQKKNETIAAQAQIIAAQTNTPST